MNMRELYDHFKISGSEAEDALAEEEIPVGHPWFLSVLHGLGAWLTTLSFLAFYLLSASAHVQSWKVSNEWVMTLTGLVLLVMMFLVKPVHEFSRHLRVSFSLVGQVLVAWGVYSLSHRLDLAALAVVVMEVVLFLGCRDDFLRFVSCWVALAAALFWIEISNLPQWNYALTAVVAAAYSAVMLREPHWVLGMYADAYRALGYGLGTALLWLTFPTLNLMPQYFPVIAHWPEGLLLLWVWAVVAWVIYRRTSAAQAAAFHPVYWLVPAWLFALATLSQPSLGAALWVGLLAFYRGKRFLRNIAYVYGACSFAVIYVNLDISSGLKSLMLIAVGLLCVALVAFIYRSAEPTNHA